MKNRILLVEDNIDLIDLLSNALKFLAFEAVIARDGLAAVELAESANPDLIIMDIGLPKLNGMDAITKIRANPKTKFIPIIAATARAMRGDRESCLRGGCDAYLAKPFSLQELSDTIELILQNQPIRKIASRAR
ncbi:MAG: response regulator [Candidatus Binatia bacterium]